MSEFQVFQEWNPLESPWKAGGMSPFLSPWNGSPPPVPGECLNVPSLFFFSPWNLSSSVPFCPLSSVPLFSPFFFSSSLLEVKKRRSAVKFSVKEVHGGRGR